MESRSTITYIIPGDPIPLARARVSNRRVFDSQREVKLYTRITIESQHGLRPPFQNKPLLLDITFFMKLPKSIKLRSHYLRQHYHIFRPDLSNMIKLIEDVASGGLLYHDDCLIAAITSRKVYDENPRTEFTITEIKL